MTDVKMKEQLMAMDKVIIETEVFELHKTLTVNEDGLDHDKP